MKKVRVTFNEAMDAISKCQTQDEALKILKDRFGENATFDIKLWFNFYDLPTGKTPAKNRRRKK